MNANLMNSSPSIDSKSVPTTATGHGVNGALSKPEVNVRARILLVDDRSDKLLALEAILEPLGQIVVSVRSGKEALRQLLKQDFAVILLDVSMPGMDGFETASLIRQRPSSENTPIIFVTSIGATENHVTQGYSLGAVDYLLTPVVPDILRAKVSVFVQLQKQTELIKRQAEQLQRVEEAKHQRELATLADRLEVETRQNRFFTLALELLGIADLNGRLLQMNGAWEKVLGHSEAELKAVTGFDLVHPEDRENLLAGISALRAGNPIPEFEGRFRHKDGSYRWLTGTAVPFLHEQLMYIFARDITPRKRAEAEIKQLNQELQHRVAALTEVNRELEAFNYSLAHDLRAPLRAMTGFSKALLSDESDMLSAEGKEYASRIVRSAKFMDALLLDMLAYSRLSRTEMTPALIDLEGPVHEQLQILERDIGERGFQVEVVSPLASVYGHLPTVKQILANLIGNSVKFTADGRKPVIRIWTEPREAALETNAPGNGTTAAVSLSQASENNSPPSAGNRPLASPCVRLWVEDNGIGIPSEHHEKIFGLFQRLHDAETYPGTGIGLALVRKGAERMGGRVGVKSQPGEGSRFWVDLPAGPAQTD
jgi:PAS domain S-box-containing protein